MISHVLGKGQGYPQGSKMPGAFDTVEAMLRAFVRDYKPRSSEREPGKVQEPELMLITFTDEENKQIREETGHKVRINAMTYIATNLNDELGLSKGFEPVLFETDPVSSRINIGMFFCPDSADLPPDEDGLKTGPTQDESLEPVSYYILDFLSRNESRM